MNKEYDHRNGRKYKKVDELPVGTTKKQGNKLTGLLEKAHELRVQDGADIYEKDGVKYIVNDAPVDVYCEIDGKPDHITLEAGVWRVEK